ncbi:MAG: pantoate--beta-alanine ligase, partial [Bacteroidetes bacterium]|nr:pantoate--beta-alanine ligase [Bacteroidota bacterium]
KAYFGQKDYQQCAIIKKMVEHFNLKTELICCPVIREKDGLAMSSRNLRLTPKERDFAPTIYQSLIGAKELLGKSTIKEIKSWAESLLSKNDLVELEYFEIRNAEDLKPVKDVNEVNELAILAALKVGKVRLIDNILVKPH